MERVGSEHINRSATLITEAGCYPPWISRLLTGRGHKVIVANSRKLRAIYEADNKNDQRDAEMLARIGRFDRKLLYGIDHTRSKRINAH